MKTAGLELWPQFVCKYFSNVWANFAGVKTSVGSHGKVASDQSLAHLQRCMKTGGCVHSEEEMDGDKAAMQMDGDGGMQEDGCQDGGGGF